MKHSMYSLSDCTKVDGEIFYSMRDQINTQPRLCYLLHVIIIRDFQ
jgi:hypothetical protein